MEKIYYLLISYVVVYIGYKKTYDMIPHNCLKMFGTSDKVIKFIEETMKNWRVELTAGRKV